MFYALTITSVTESIQLATCRQAFENVVHVALRTTAQFAEFLLCCIPAEVKQRATGEVMTQAARQQLNPKRVLSQAMDTCSA